MICDLFQTYNTNSYKWSSAPLSDCCTTGISQLCKNIS